MTIYSRGSWVDGSHHCIIDDNSTKPTPEQIMSFFLRMTEDELISALSAETSVGTLTHKQADRIMTGYFKKKTQFAYHRK